MLVSSNKNGVSLKIIFFFSDYVELFFFIIYSVLFIFFLLSEKYLQSFGYETYKGR